MFHQFYVDEELRNYLRFLWWEDEDLSAEPREFRMTVHLFGAASSPGCANFGLKHLARQHQKDMPRASTFIEKDFYVDDGLTSVKTIQEAKELIKSAQELCSKGGLRLHKFNSNVKKVLDCVDPTERAAPTEHLDLTLSPAPTERALGVKWCIEDDSLSFGVELKDQPSSRGGMLSVVASLYVVTPFTLIGKRILQELCRRAVRWDDALPEDLKLQCENWMYGLLKLKEIKIPRCYHPVNFGSILKTELHHFSDASSIGYGACSYLRFKTTTGQVHASLLMSKARVAPSKITSIPRLELSAAVTSAKLSVLLKSELDMKIDAEYFWTDSQVVLGYINNEARRFHVFVANRVQLIREVSNPDQWHYIDTSENPADHTSRGLQPLELSSSNWFSGPSFLWEDEVQPIVYPSPDLIVGDPEVRTAQAFMTQSSDEETFVTRFSRFSSWTTLLKVVARIKRLGSKGERKKGIITVQEREEAALVIIKLAQNEAFHKDIKTLKAGKDLPRSSPLYSLDAFLDEDIFRVGGRLKHSSLSIEVKHPIILPKNAHITYLILSYYHAQTCHQGRGQTHMELRANGFWVINGNRLIAKLIYNCIICRRQRRSLGEQKMADLPKERVEGSAPFTYCGMDCFGPFITKKARKEFKRYGLILTCLSSRAIHIEMIDDLSTDVFINALRCFISLRGTVRQLRCDQGSNFIGARNEFAAAERQIDTNALAEFLAQNQCEFLFNAPAASHAGGVWERQIKTVRSVLNNTLAKYCGRLDDSSLRTLFYEAMAIVNSRPLTVDQINNPDSPEPLTPNHLIMMKSKIAPPPPGHFVEEDVYAAKRWRRVQYLVEQFWSRWRKEYLLNVSRRQKWHLPRRNIKVDDIVIIKDENLPRNHWRLGRVVEANKESDGLVRRVRLRLGRTQFGGNREQSIEIERPIQKLVLLLEAD